MIRITREDTMAASAPCAKKLLAAFLWSETCGSPRKFSPIEVDDEWGNDGTDFQRERKHETGTVVYEE